LRVGGDSASYEYSAILFWYIHAKGWPIYRTQIIVFVSFQSGSEPVRVRIAADKTKKPDQTLRGEVWLQTTSLTVLPLVVNITSLTVRLTSAREPGVFSLPFG
jgi:hypothetical protein